MGVGIHGVHDRDRVGMAREAGFRVLIGEEGAQYEVADRVSALRYSTRLPGGFAECTFNLHMSLLAAVDFLTHLAPLQVFFDGSLAWEGRIEEPPRGTYGTESLPVTALGRGAKLKRQKFTKVFVTSGYDRWRPAWETVTGDAPPVNTQQASPSYAADADPNPGFVVGFPNASAVHVTADDAAWLWIPPPGTDIFRVAGTLNVVGTSTVTSTALYALTTLTGFGGATAETILAGRTISAGNTTFDDTLSTSSVIALRIDFDQGSTGTAATDEFFHYHSMKIVGARTVDGAVFDPAAVTSYAVIRSLLSEFGGSVVQSSAEAMLFERLLRGGIPGNTNVPTFAWSELVFDTPTTVEEAIERVNAPVGWEWGVFENGLFYYGPIQLITTLRFESNDNALANDLIGMVTNPPWWLDALAQDGNRIELAQSVSDIVNEVIVTYTDAAGTPQRAYSSDFTNGQNPLNLPDGSGARDIVTGYVDLPGTSDATTAAQVASAYLAQYSRPQVKGEITWAGFRAPKIQYSSRVESNPAEALQLPAEFRPESMPTPLIRPGHWVEVGDAIGLIDVSWPTLRRVGDDQSGSDRPAPSTLLPIRSVEVNADTGEVTCAVDSSRDVMSVTLARLQLAQAA